TSGGGLAISPGGIFFGTPTSTRFGTYNSGTGAYSNITAPTRPVGGAYAALDFDGSTLYGLDLGPGPALATHLVTINTANGAVTDIGGSVSSLDAIAFQPVPEPSTAALMLTFGGLLAARRRK
ncbi:MAG TPA: PEP-CTERM sorting domain-containing protein, partial [Candidatus Dormibacteraeota bacterium]|nr:PEP-CTERM sorting domain-containing protein [Candidatus Dormibacteraeota bacterium]